MGMSDKPLTMDIASDKWNIPLCVKDTDQKMKEHCMYSFLVVNFVQFLIHYFLHYPAANSL